MPAYIRVSKGFHVGPLKSMDAYAGVSVAGEEGFYLLFNVRQINQAFAKFQLSVARAMGPFGEPLMKKDFDSLNTEDVWRGTYADLPDTIVRHPDWPKSGEVHDVWFLPADAIERVTLSFWFGAKVWLPDAEFNLHVGPFAFRAVRDQLRTMGWLDRKP